MSVDVTKLQFYSGDVTDKIAYYITKIDSSGAGRNLHLSVGTATFGSPSCFMGTIANPYGKKCLPTLSWSLDGTNYLPQGVPIFYYNSTHLQYGVQAKVFAGCSDTEIYIGVYTEYDVAAQTVFVQLAVDSIS